MDRDEAVLTRQIPRWPLAVATRRGRWSVLGLARGPAPTPEDRMVRQAQERQLRPLAALREPSRASGVPARSRAD